MATSNSSVTSNLVSLLLAVVGVPIVACISSAAVVPFFLSLLLLLFLLLLLSMLVLAFLLLLVSLLILASLLLLVFSFSHLLLLALGAPAVVSIQNTTKNINQTMI